MDYSERTECASLIEIIRVITAKQLLAYHLLLRDVNVFSAFLTQLFICFISSFCYLYNQQ
jgi:hypothetical protein